MNNTKITDYWNPIWRCWRALMRPAAGGDCGNKGDYWRLLIKAVGASGTATILQQQRLPKNREHLIETRYDVVGEFWRGQQQAVIMGVKVWETNAAGQVFATRGTSVVLLNHLPIERPLNMFYHRRLPLWGMEGAVRDAGQDIWWKTADGGTGPPFRFKFLWTSNTTRQNELSSE